MSSYDALPAGFSRDCLGGPCYRCDYIDNYPCDECGELADQNSLIIVDAERVAFCSSTCLREWSTPTTVFNSPVTNAQLALIVPVFAVLWVVVILAAGRV